MMKTILYFVAEDYYFCTHRLFLAKAVQAAGFNVIVVTRLGKYQQVIENNGLKVIGLKNFSRGKGSVWQTLKAIMEIYGIYRKVQPDIVHHVAMKPVFIGTLVARFLKIPKIINAFGGLGYLFITKSWKGRCIRFLMVSLFRALLKSPQSYLILQNKDDIALLLRQNLISKDRMILIPGSGVNLDQFPQTDFPLVTKDGPIIAFVSRMLWDKGIGELISAMRMLKNAGYKFQARFYGGMDQENPSSVSEKQLILWEEEGLIRWHRHTEDVRKAYAESHVAILPSYREGLPKSLLEAASIGRPIITTDVPGCREVVQDGVTGILVPLKDVTALKEAILLMIENAPLRQQYGDAGRKRVEQKFSDTFIHAQTLRIYEDNVSMAFGPGECPKT